MTVLPPTASQTVGPFFAIGLTWPDGDHVVMANDPAAIVIHGVVFDGDGQPIPDAMVETWQADPEGRYAHPDDPRGAETSFRGFGRSGTDQTGAWSIVTVKPGPVPGPNGALQAPHIEVSVFARGLLQRVVTRIYFPDEEAANAADPVLAALPATAASETLIAQESDEGYRFDIHLQGEHETVFFAV
ncbi:MAG: protocatechuate 3,4-dioxygenase subunit alpha [Thermoleophilaceae bacterium]